jgi:putative transposase
MQKPLRNLRPKPDSARSRTFLVTAKTSQGKALLQSERMATLFIDVLRSFAGDARFKIHEFVVMRNFVQLIVSVHGETTIEDAVRHIKGRFAGRAVRDLAIKGWIWERDVSSVLIPDRASFLKRKLLILENPVKAGMAQSAEEYPYCSAYLRKNKSATKAAADSWHNPGRPS